MPVSKSSNKWLSRQRKDPYVKQAQAANLRSRASFKLTQLDDKYRLLKAGNLVVDLGAAPGSWSDAARIRVGDKGKVVACDLLPMKPLPKIQFVQGDFSTEVVQQKVLAALAGNRPNVVLSDMAPNLTGNRIQDQAQVMKLAWHVLDFAKCHLKPEGSLVTKVFQGEDLDDWLSAIKGAFKQVRLSKPDASRSRSREFYVVGLRRLKNSNPI